jgi:DNA-nicking Smr family endonuclease
MAPRINADSALWQRATRDVKRLTLRPEPLSPPVNSRPALKPAVVKLRAPPPPEPAPLRPLDSFAGIDRANAERLKRGKHRIDARLDLHGMTQDEAHRALAFFIRASRADGKRCVLVITGRGSAGGGVLKEAVPRWLHEPEFRSHLLAIAAAQPRDGGNGALYVMLRRTRVG